MSKIEFLLFGILLVPTLLFLLEFYLCKHQLQAAVIVPIVAACCFILVGFYALIVSGILFGIYFVMGHLHRKKQAQQSEFDQMRMQDLE